MKKHSLLCLNISMVCLGVFASEVRAQGQIKSVSRKVQVAANPKSQPASWLFILETDSQWSLVLQPQTNTTSMPGSSAVQTNRSRKVTSAAMATTSSVRTPNSTSRLDSANNSDLNTGMGASRGNKSGGALTEAGTQDDGSSNQLIFEGNTDDAPLVERPGQSNKPKPIKPSAPNS